MPTALSARLKLYDATFDRLPACPAYRRLRATLTAVNELTDDLETLLADLNGRTTLAEFFDTFGPAEVRREVVAAAVSLSHLAGFIESALPPAPVHRKPK